MVKIFELGPCQVYFNDKYIGHTLRTDSTSLKLQAITQEIKTDESSEIKEILGLGRNITFETTVLLDENSINTFGITPDVKTLVKKGVIEIVTMSNSVRIKLLSAVITLEINFNFKTEGTHSVKIKAKALRNEDNKDIEIIT